MAVRADDFDIWFCGMTDSIKIFVDMLENVLRDHLMFLLKDT